MVKSFFDEATLKKVYDTVLSLSIAYPEMRGYTKQRIAEAVKTLNGHFTYETIARYVRLGVQRKRLIRVEPGGRNRLALYNYNWGYSWH